MRPDVIAFEPIFNAPDEVMAPRVEAPAVSDVVKRFVEDAVVEKKAVEVALVEVEFTVVRLVIVDVALFTSMPPNRVASPVVCSVDDANTPPLALRENRWFNKES
jgi:hypothetical protein